MTIIGIGEFKRHRIASFMAKLRKMFIRIWLGGGIKSMSVPIPVHKIKGEIEIEYDESFNIRGFSSKCFNCIFSIFCY